MVYLDHTLRDQNHTVDRLMDHKEFWIVWIMTLVYDIKLQQKFAMKMVTIYRDLLETIGGLFSDMMDNNLNHLMKYLDCGISGGSAVLDRGSYGDQHRGLPGKTTIGDCRL